MATDVKTYLFYGFYINMTLSEFKKKLYSKIDKSYFVFKMLCTHYKWIDNVSDWSEQDLVGILLGAKGKTVEEIENNIFEVLKPFEFIKTSPNYSYRISIALSDFLLKGNYLKYQKDSPSMIEIPTVTEEHQKRLEGFIKITGLTKSQTGPVSWHLMSAPQSKRLIR